LKSILVFIFAAVTAVIAQTGSSQATQSKPAADTGKPRMTVDVRPAPPTPLPSQELVTQFLRRWVGQDESLKYKVLGISPSEIPGVAHVVVQVGENQPPTHLYVTPDGEHAIVGEVIPFGANPFAPAKRKLDAQARGHKLGATTPRVTLVEFSDLQCPHCKAAQPIIERLLADTPGAQLIFQPFPLSIHDWASKAALYGECVAQKNPNAFWNYIREVFAQQDQITGANAPEKLQAIASRSNVSADAMKACLANPETARRVQQSIDLGMQLGVSGTPTLFINGRKVRSVTDFPYEQLRKLVEFEATQK
jgi:protein-disulfide isomerase